MPQVGSGPLWDLHWQEESRRCKQSWLFNVLYLNVFINYDTFVGVQYFLILFILIYDIILIFRLFFLNEITIS